MLVSRKAERMLGLGEAGTREVGVMCGACLQWCTVISDLAGESGSLAPTGASHLGSYQLQAKLPLSVPKVGIIVPALTT